MTPGASISAEANASPPITRSAPTTDPMRCGPSTPFCRLMQTPPWDSSGSMSSAASSVSNSFTQNSTTSTGATRLGSPVACAPAMTVSPAGPVSLSPFDWIARRCSPRAMKVTSWPAWASRPP
ncbi:hypothetical protein D3C83_25240 [compost metagenome]